MDLNTVEGCCGIRELDGVREVAKGNVANTVAAIAPSIIEQPFAVAFFSQATPTTPTKRTWGQYGEVLADFIRSHNLGALVETGYQKNPNSGNMLKVWLWEIDRPAIKKWLAGRSKK